jgi:hypothetical protein
MKSTAALIQLGSALALSASLSKSRWRLRHRGVGAGRNGSVFDLSWTHFVRRSTLAVMTEPAAAETLRSAAGSRQNKALETGTCHFEGDETLQDLNHKLDTVPSAKLDPTPGATK